MKKRILSGLLALALTAGLVPSALAASSQREEAALVLSALDIMSGDENGNLDLGRTISRAEFTRMVISASPYREAAGDAASVAPYPDVPRTHWAASYIQLAVRAGYVSGYLDGTFRPENPITLAEGVVMVLNLLGYQQSDFTGAWPAGQMAAYHNLGLDENISASADTPMTREHALYLFYNLLTTRSKEGNYYLNALEPTLNLVDSQGELDPIALVNFTMDGPVVVAQGWESDLPFSTTGATVYRDGRSSTVSAIQLQDVLYWSEPMRTLWAYSKRSTGILEAISPNVAAPTSITVAGETYNLETQEAVYACSDLGSCRVGDTVTVLVGRSGGAAAVLGLDENTADSNLVYGMVTQSDKQSYTDENGNAYTRNTITLYTTTGNTVTYPVTTSSYEAGDLVRVAITNGQIQVRRLSTTSTLEGTITADGKRLGSYTLADNVGILDTSGSSVVRLYPSRLAGMKLTKSMVRFYSTNEQGEIDHLILKDATGDMHSYGILTSVNEINEGMMTSGTYVVDVGGTSTTIQTPNSIYHIAPGPCMVIGSLQNPDRIYNLTGVRLETITGNTGLTESNQKYHIWDQVAVYEVRNGNYYLSSLERVTGGGYSLSGYYDSEQQGSCIRVILARES